MRVKHLERKPAARVFLRQTDFKTDAFMIEIYGCEAYTCYTYEAVEMEKNINISNKMQKDSPLCSRHFHSLSGQMKRNEAKSSNNKK